MVWREAAVESLDVQSPHRSHQNIGRQCGENSKGNVPKGSIDRTGLIFDGIEVWRGKKYEYLDHGSEYEVCSKERMASGRRPMGMRADESPIQRSSLPSLGIKRENL